MSIQTVLGAIDRISLGVVMPHEHIFIDLSGFFENKDIPGCQNAATDAVTIDKLGILSRDPYALRNNLLLDDFDVQKAEIFAALDAGCRTVVDQTTIGLGRDIRQLRKMATATGLNIVAGTGFYVSATHSHKTREASVEKIADMMCHELLKGVDGTDIRAGLIGELGVSELFDASERKVLRAAALAHVRTGSPVSVHINPWTTYGLEAAEILLEGGVAPEKLCVCHIDVENRLEYIMSLLKLGVFVEFDNFGKEYFVARSTRRFGYGTFVTDTQRVELLVMLILKGFEKQILLSCDVCLKTLLHAYGGWGYDHLLRNIVPMLLDEGVTREQLDALLIDNPARFLDVQVRR